MKKNNQILKTTRCTKGEVKIHPSENDCKSGYNDDQTQFYTKIKEQNKPSGVRINLTNNNYLHDPFDGIDPFLNPDGEKNVEVKEAANLGHLDLNIDNYSQPELYKLFGIEDNHILTNAILKICKKTVLKTHPDKSGIDSKYFLFFSKAYKRLFSIYEFQNKTENKLSNKDNSDNSEYYDSSKTGALDQMFQKNKSLKETDNFNKWFNEQFDKHKIDDGLEKGYGTWLKSDENVENLCNISSRANLASEIEKKKKQLQSVTEYKGVTTQYFATSNGCSLMDYNNNYNSSGLFSNDGIGYTDLKQAYIESVIPVTEDDYNKMPKFKNVDEYNRYRNSVDMTLPSKEESMRKLYQENAVHDEQSTALAFHFAKQSEKTKQNEQLFWSNIKQLDN
jgi:hypothetical protein